VNQGTYKRILVTGSSAVLGTALRWISEQYPGRNFRFLTSRDCDLTEKDATFKCIESFQPDAIIHLAALSGGISLSMNHPATILRENVSMNLNVLEAARAFKVAKIVMTLSTGMYPADAPNPLREEYIHNGYPHESNYGYAFAKRLVDPAIRAYRTEYGMNVIGLIPNGIFGENDNFNHEDASMLPALIRRFYENRSGASKITVWGDGSPLREYTYARDLARAYMWCLDNYDCQQVLNIGSTEEHSIKEIAFMVADSIGINSNRIEFDLAKPAGIFKKSTDNSRFVNLSCFTYTPFRTGLEYTIRWFIRTAEEHPERLRLGSKLKVKVRTVQPEVTE